MYEFSATTKSLPTKVFHIWSEKYSENGVPMNAWGWAFYVGEINTEGNEEPIYDGWDTEFDVIVQYPSRYTDEKLEWIDEAGNQIDFEQFKRELESYDE